MALPPVRTLPPASSRALDEPDDALELVLGDHRSHLGVVRERVADLDRLDGRHELRQDVVVGARPDQDPRGRRAVLSGVEVPADLDPLDDLLHVGVVEDDERRLPTELEVHALQRLGRVRRDQLARRRVAGERHDPDVGVPDDRVTDGDPVARDDVEHAGREAGRR